MIRRHETTPMTAELDSPAPLDDRLAAAFTDGATPDTVTALIQET